MGFLSSPRRPREPRLPLYSTIGSYPTKEHCSDDGYESSDVESEISLSSSSSPYSSGNVSDAAPALSLLRSKRAPPPSRCKNLSLYPYRLPTKVTRYVFVAVVGTTLLLILTLVRASQVENWKVANGKINTPPPPPPIWERFPFLERYYGGLRTVTSFRESNPQYPRPHEPPAVARPAEKAAGKIQPGIRQRNVPESKPWDEYAARSKEAGMQQCFLDAAGKVRPPPLRYYEGRPLGFPENVAGSYDVLKLPEDVCFERFGRYGPYGFGYSTRTGGLGIGEHGESEGSDAVWNTTSRVDYRDVNWADAQRRCFRSNQHRFKTLPNETPAPHGFYIGHPAAATTETTHAPSDSPTDKDAQDRPDPPKIEKKARTAVVVRCWDEYLFREDDIANIRSMISELALGSGGRYDIHLLVQVKNDGRHPIWADHEAYEARIRESIPKEFRDLVTLWTETQMLSLYQGVYDLWSRGPELPVHGVYRGLSMAMQHFAYMHPEYDYFWQWEMDIRYTGHYYDLVTRLEDWAKAQPRKGLWERNARFYFPTVHGSWEDFSQMARVQSEMGVVGSDNVWKNVPDQGNAPPHRDDKKADKPVWGPVRPSDQGDWFEVDNDPAPPTTYAADRYEWGVGEEADFISLNPIFNPDGTTWALKEDITGFNRSHPTPPRRAAIITTSRMSRRLLMAMHRMTAYKKQFAFPEMWPATVALHHGYKAVFAPHPMYVDRRWPVDFMAQTFNGGHGGGSGGSRTSIYGDREHNLRGVSWFYNSGFAPNLYRRWLGLKVNNDGGEEFEKTEDKSKEGPGVSNMAGGEGRMCLPPMLLHPIKDVALPIEAAPAADGEAEGVGVVPASDPAA
ncbi:hypothetical protein DCS_07581 [Drechmeria coniospora]|uniref:Major facilitator superfamily transporter n=1 Tax=Drechmeria coniospora TaxID=98403 RepID=A0A151GEV4_DRECN|nr:hypothetical protein DCS_07581 [Drechmeria coniospora]KYK55618.1 hypothetical protein DCS_07581 [Drechmeria coniospora]